MADLAHLLKNKQKLKAKILALPRSEVKKYHKLLKILVLTDRQAIDALAAAYFKHKSGINPIPTDHILPKDFVIGFNDDKEFFYYYSDLLKERVNS